MSFNVFDFTKNMYVILVELFSIVYKTLLKYYSHVLLSIVKIEFTKYYSFYFKKVWKKCTSLPCFSLFSSISFLCCYSKNPQQIWQTRSFSNIGSFFHGVNSFYNKYFLHWNSFWREKWFILGLVFSTSELIFLESKFQCGM